VTAEQCKTFGSLVSAADPAPVVPAARTDRPAKAASPAKSEPPGLAREPVVPDMMMRSWYMPKASADRLAALVDNVHFATRLPNHVIMGALVNVIDRNAAHGVDSYEATQITHVSQGCSG
jgi:hypothetical protein